MNKQELFEHYEKLVKALPDDFILQLKRKTIEEYKQNPDAFSTDEEKQASQKENDELINHVVENMMPWMR